MLGSLTHVHDVRSVVRYHHQIPATIGLCIHPTCKPRPRSASSQQVLLPPHWPRPGPRPRAAGCQNGAVSVSEPRRPQSPARHSRTFTEIRKQAASPQHSELALSLSLSRSPSFLPPQNEAQLGQVGAQGQAQGHEGARGSASRTAQKAPTSQADHG